MRKRNENQRENGMLIHELLIVEDLALLMMDDRSVAIAGAGTLYYTLGGAALVELGLGGRIRADENAAVLRTVAAVCTGTVVAVTS